MTKNTLYKKIIGLSLISLLSEELSSIQYKILIEQLCNKLVESSDEIKQKFIEAGVLSYVNQQSVYDNENLFEVLFSTVAQRKMSEIEKEISSHGSESSFSSFDSIFIYSDTNKFHH